METDKAHLKGASDEFIIDMDGKSLSRRDSLRDNSISELQPTRRVESDAIPGSTAMQIERESEQLRGDI